VIEGFRQFLLERPVLLFEIRKFCCGHLKRSPVDVEPMTSGVCHANCGKSIAGFCAAHQIHRIVKISFTYPLS
jgi:hypothetical protein